MRRRVFITLLGTSVAALPLAVNAQQARKVPLVGVLMPFEKGDEEGERSHDARNRGRGAYTRGEDEQFLCSRPLRAQSRVICAREERRSDRAAEPGC